MSANDPAGDLAPAAPAADPHAPKLLPDDPRLRLGRSAARTLRTGPLVALATVPLGAVGLAVALAFQPSAPASLARPDPSGAPPAPPVVPETIRNAPARPAAPLAPADAGAPGRVPPVREGTGPGTEARLAHDEAFKAENAAILFETNAGASDAPRTAEPAHPPLPSNAPAPTATFGASSDPNGQDRKNAFLDGLGQKTSDVLTTTLEPPKSPYALLAGTIVPTVLITAINSDLPGPVLGQVRENVYDTATGNVLLIPQGSRLLAHYDSMVAWGQERVLLCWNRLLLPNGDSINLQCMPAADLQGAAGLTDQVDEHWFRILKGAAVASLLAATTQAVAGNTESFNPTVPQMWAHGAASDINQVGQGLTARNLTIQPTITVRPGYAVNVIVTRDIVLPPYPDPPSALGLRP